MNPSAKKQRHELARKQHKHDAQQHARELARRPKTPVAAWVLGVGITLMIVGLVVALLVA